MNDFKLGDYRPMDLIDNYCLLWLELGNHEAVLPT